MNLIGFWTLYIKEVRRFVGIYHQTLVSPAINALIFYLIFTMAFKNKMDVGYGYSMFIGSGLLIMSILQNSNANSSATISMSKILGFMADYLTPPLSRIEFMLAIICASVTRGFAVGVSVTLILLPFVGFELSSVNFGLLFIYFLLSSVFFSIIGLIFGAMSSSFDQVHAYTNYVITPLTFLSGTFYRVADLPVFWQKLIHINPVFYMIDGFRYSVIGISDSNIFYGIVFVLLCGIVGFVGAFFTLKRFYNLES